MVLCKWLHCDLRPYPQVSGPWPFGTSCFFINNSFLMMLCMYFLGQNCLHLTMLPYLSSGTYSCKHEKLPNIVIHACKNKMNLLKISDPQIPFCSLMFRPIVLKQLNSLLTIVTLSLLYGAVLTHPLWVQEVLGLNSWSRQWFLCLILYFVVVFLLFVHQHIICHNICKSFFNVNLFSIQVARLATYYKV